MGNLVVIDASKRQVPDRPWKPFPKCLPTGVNDQHHDDGESRGGCQSDGDAAPNSGRVIFMLDPVSGLSEFRMSTPDLLWWTYAQFMPYDDSKLLSSVGVYVPRPGRTVTGAHRRVQGRIGLWNLSIHPVDVTLICQRGSATWPHCQVTPNSKYLCYIGRGEVVKENLKTKQRQVKHRDLRMGNFRFCALSPNGLYLAILMRVGNQFELAVVTVEMFQKCAEVMCHHLCPSFVGSPNYSDHVECSFSPNSKYIAVSSSFGKLFVVKREGLKLHKLMTPGIVSSDHGALEDARAFDFDPRYNHEVIAFSTTDKHILVYNLEHENCVIDEELPQDVGTVEVLKYSSDGYLLAVATSSTILLMYDSDSFNLVYTLDISTQSSKYAMGPMPNGYPAMLRLAWSHSGQQLAVCSADGFIRIWQLPRYLNLQHFCRLTIIKHLPAKQVYSLPLPSKLIDFILYNPTR
ncbi:uncharacterized protein [Ptychodera flava]|uniref:uncharacterized protein n=1 Tax=Ptychodera flava TaxID=63121 RepID=UPI00396A71F9